jgi:DNA polymerase III delta subunit
MLRVYYGSDRAAAIDAAHQDAKAASGSFDTIDASSYQPNQFDDLTASASLFGGVQAYIIDTPSSDAEFKEACYQALKEMAASENNFYLVEGTLLAPAKKKLAQPAESITEFSATKAEQFNTFSLADALAKKDKKSLWVLVQEAQLLGIRDEEIIGILWWQLKTIRLAAMTTTATEAGVKDYPYRKAKQALQKYSEGDIARHSHTLLKLYHQGHKGRVDLRLALEKWVLSL